MSDKYYWGFTIRTIFRNCYRIFLFWWKRESVRKKKKEKNDIKNIPGMAIWLSVEVSVWPGLRHEQYLNENYLEIARQPLYRKSVCSCVNFLFVLKFPWVVQLACSLSQSQWSNFLNSIFVRFCVKHVLKHACMNSVGRTQRKLNFVCRKVVKYPTCGNHLNRSKKLSSKRFDGILISLSEMHSD